MAGSVNKVMLIGNVGKDPEVRTFNNGGKVANFSIATSERWRDKKTGEKREKIEWHNIAVTNPALVETVEKYVEKGTKVYIEGKLQTRKWQDREGHDRYTTEVTLSGFGVTLTILDSKDVGHLAEPNNHDDDYDNESPNPIRDFDDEIPF